MNALLRDGEIEGGLKSCEGKLAYLGLQRRPVHRRLAPTCTEPGAYFVNRTQDSGFYEVVEEREDTGGILTFLTNHVKLGATVIAGIYIDRWRIEFFQGLQAKSEDHYVRGHFGQRDECPDLHSIDPAPHPHTDCP